MTSNNIDAVKKALEKILHDEDLLKNRDLRITRRAKIKDEWYFYSLSYLYATSTLVGHSLKTRNIYGRMHVIPSIYNFRHGIELSLKYLFKELEINTTKSHDISELYEQLTQKLKKTIVSKVKDFVKNEETTLNENGVLKVLNENIDKLSSLVNKYYFQTPLLKHLKEENLYLEDHDNELFKYPEARNVTLTFQSIAMIRIKDDELRLIKEDIDTMINIVELFFAFYNPKNNLNSKDK